MITASEALDLLFALAQPLEVEEVSISEANGRVLAQTLAAKRTQPPFPASAMDGYAVGGGQPTLGERFRLVGESAAGHAWGGTLRAGECVRIFTGAPVPQGGDFVVIQEDTSRISTEVTISREPSPDDNIRRAGIDFEVGTPLPAPRRLRAAEVALLAAMNHARVPVTRKPVVALISTGDELVMPGESPSPDQIIASNTFGLKALLQDHGAIVRILPIAKDREASIAQTLALAADADLIITIGGASVGDHDLVSAVTRGLGADQSFHKVAMRPGKPLMAGKIGQSMMIGLPGNPVSALVCGHIFVVPVIKAMLGLPAVPAVRLKAPLAEPVGANGPREHYMRANITPEGVVSKEDQDSSLLSVLASANALLVRPASDGPRQAGEIVEYIPI